MISKFFGPIAGAVALSSWALLTLVSGVGCAALYPEISTPLKPMPADADLNPPPPRDMLFIAFHGATIPKLTRDGRPWDEFKGGAPDSYGVVKIGEEEVFRTDVESDTFNPRWEHSLRENWEIPRGRSITVEVWEQNNVVDRPICRREIREPHEEARLSAGPFEIRCDSGALVDVELSPAKPKLGLGLSYEIRSESVAVTRAMPRSPAARANLKRGDLITHVNEKSVKGMSDAELRTIINSNAKAGVRFTIKTKTGQMRSFSIKEGPIYSLKPRTL